MITGMLSAPPLSASHLAACDDHGIENPTGKFKVWCRDNVGLFEGGTGGAEIAYPYGLADAVAVARAMAALGYRFKRLATPGRLNDGEMTIARVSPSFWTTGE